jgi:hypothetical protein
VDAVDESVTVITNRFVEARRYGLTPSQARRFACSTIDIGTLRKLQQAGCPPELAARILQPDDDS